MVFNSYAIVQRAIEEGFDYGYMRAHKHTDNPSEAALKEAIIHGIMTELDEIITWDKLDEECTLS